jgi:hypothetical protein
MRWRQMPPSPNVITAKENHVSRHYSHVWPSPTAEQSAYLATHPGMSPAEPGDCSLVGWVLGLAVCFAVIQAATRR